MADEPPVDRRIGDGPQSPAEYENDEATSHSTPNPFTASTQLSFAAASSQFTALTRFRAESDATVALENPAQRHDEYEQIFLRDGVLELDSNGLRGIVAYLRAAEAIQAKAAALGYGSMSTVAPITSVPGGYVGRYSGNDIYAAG